MSKMIKRKPLPRKITVKPKTEKVYVAQKPQPTKLQKWLARAPIAEGIPTQRWYGETFLPAYEKWLAEGKQLVK